MAKQKVVAKSKVGDIISFERDGKQLVGQVLNVYINSVCVQLTDASANLLRVQRTVVAHKNYIVSGVKLTD